MPKKKKKIPPIWKIYLTWSQLNNEYYLGLTSKTGKALDNYFGSSKRSSSWEDKDKVILYETERKSEGKYLEAFLQMCYRHDDRCVNDMLNLRINMRHTKGLTDDDIFKCREHASSLLEMRLKRCSSDLQGRDDALLRLHLLLSEPEGGIQ